MPTEQGSPPDTTVAKLRRIIEEMSKSSSEGLYDWRKDAEAILQIASIEDTEAIVLRDAVDVLRWLGWHELADKVDNAAEVMDGAIAAVRAQRKK